jgi:hypothetical protein
MIQELLPQADRIADPGLKARGDILAITESSTDGPISTLHRELGGPAHGDGGHGHAP